MHKIQVGIAILALWFVIIPRGALVAAEIVGPNFVDVSKAGLVRFHAVADEGHAVKWVFEKLQTIDGGCQRYTDEKTGRPCILFAVPRQPQTIQIMVIDAWVTDDGIQLRETLVALVAGHSSDRPDSGSDNVLDVVKQERCWVREKEKPMPAAGDPSRRSMSVSPAPHLGPGETGDRFKIFYVGNQKYVEDTQSGLPYLVQDDGSFRIGDETFKVTE